MYLRLQVIHAHLAVDELLPYVRAAVAAIVIVIVVIVIAVVIIVVFVLMLSVIAAASSAATAAAIVVIGIAVGGSGVLAVISTVEFSVFLVSDSL